MKKIEKQSKNRRADEAQDRAKTRKFLVAPVPLPDATLGRKVVFSGAPQAKCLDYGAKTSPNLLILHWSESVCLRLRGGGPWGVGSAAARGETRDAHWSADEARKRLVYEG